MGWGFLNLLSGNKKVEQIGPSAIPSECLVEFFREEKLDKR